MDEDVVGSRFYLMEFVQGRIFGDVRLQELEEKDRREWSVLVGALCFGSKKLMIFVGWL